MKTIAGRMINFFLMAVLVAAISMFVPRPLFLPAMTSEGGRSFLFLANAIHTDIAIPLDDATRRRFAFVGQDGLPLSDPGAQWLIIGWGGRSFYIETPTWADLKPMPFLYALTADHATMHVEIAGPIDTANPSVTAFQVSEPAFQQMLDEMLATFTRDAAGNPILINKAAYGAFDNFYEANGWFNALMGCNTFAARMARKAGLRTGLWNPLPQSLRFSLRLYN